MFWNVARIMEATGGGLKRGIADTPVSRISTDTRQLQEGDCFVALAGENHDGHAFLADALLRGASVLVVSDRSVLESVSTPAAVSVVGVEDTLYALGELARYYRRHYDIPVVGITGSNGKTSTKEMVASILSQSRSVQKNQGNFNNLIGVPLTLLGLQSQHEVAVVEMGINVPGEMARLAEIARPSVGLITNVQSAHLEGLQSLDVVLEEKGKLWVSLGPNDRAVVNLDDQRLAAFARGIAAKKTTFSMANPGADVALSGEAATCKARTVFDMKIGDRVVAIELPALGLHHVNNALAAAAAATALGMTPDAVASGLAAYRPMKMRMQVHSLRDGRTLIDDTYNANPGSVLAALRTVMSASGGNPVLVVLGEMKELGVQSGALHREVGRQAARLGVRELITLGKMGLEMRAGAVEAGMPDGSCRHAGSHQEIVEWLAGHPLKNAWVLVKGSRSMTMERVTEGLLAE
jgi:UDP-N-acetylmuramoyl-tripeptide--D-alanyl-D-alanine ligase